MAKLGDKPYWLRAIIIYPLFAGAAGVAGMILNGPTPLALSCMAAGVAGAIIWYVSNMREDGRLGSHAGQANAAASGAQGGPSGDAGLGNAPFTAEDTERLRGFVKAIQHLRNDPSLIRLDAGWMYSAPETTQYDHHDEYGKHGETIWFERPTSQNAAGTPLEEGDERAGDVGFITSRAKSATILVERGRYHVVAEEFLGIPGTTVISYEEDGE